MRLRHCGFVSILLAILFGADVVNTDFAVLPLQVSSNVWQCYYEINDYWIIGLTFKQLSGLKLEACLEECLISAVQYGARCLAALYYPNDKECSLLQENRFTRPELFIKNNASFAVNYYENHCADPEPARSPPVAKAIASIAGQYGPKGYLQLIRYSQSNSTVIISGAFRHLPKGQLQLAAFKPSKNLSICATTLSDAVRESLGPQDVMTIDFGALYSKEPSKVIVIHPQVIDYTVENIVGSILVLSDLRPPTIEIRSDQQSSPVIWPASKPDLRIHGCGEFLRKDNQSVCDHAEVVFCAGEAGFVEFGSRLEKEGGALLLKIPLEDREYKDQCEKLRNFSICVNKVVAGTNCVLNDNLNSFVRTIEGAICTQRFRDNVVTNRDCVKRLIADPVLVGCGETLKRQMDGRLEPIIEGVSTAMCEIYRGLRDFMFCLSPTAYRYCQHKLYQTATTLYAVVEYNYNYNNC